MTRRLFITVVNDGSQLRLSAFFVAVILVFYLFISSNKNLFSDYFIMAEQSTGYVQVTIRNNSIIHCSACMVHFNTQSLYHIHKFIR